jgi:hypothetical protein
VNSGSLINSSLGFGDHLDFRFRPKFSITADLGESLYGAPFRQLNFDFGGRYRPLGDVEHRVRPYVDFRVGYLLSGPQFAQPADPTSAIAAPNILARATGSGIGTLAGAGFETSIATRWSINSGIALGRYRMTSNGSYGSSGYEPSRSFGITSARFTLGLKYNPGRMVPIP